jgi:hypothetical protein
MTDRFDMSVPNLDTAASASAKGADHFTPRQWSAWLAERSGAAQAWLNGAAVLDPTCGRGDLLLGMMAAAVGSGRPAKTLPVQRLFGIERTAQHLRALAAGCRREFGVAFPTENLFHCDILRNSPSLRADVLLGNPPWANFSDLPPEEKASIKPVFVHYGLADDKRRLLLGGSRIDVAALIVVKAIADHLHPSGPATFFLPLSLLTGDGAHIGFRRYNAGGARFAVTEVVDFAGVPAFPGVSTRYGMISFRRDAAPCWPIRWSRAAGGADRWAAPIEDGDGPLAVAETPEALAEIRTRSLIKVPAGVRPRQGVNPCGASAVFFLRDVCPIDKERAAATSQAVGPTVLPRQYLYPLLSREQFSDGDKKPPKRWALLPHDPLTSQPLSTEQVAESPDLAEYLHRCRRVLENRRGSWLGRWITRGRWWAMLGVGPYCFAPYRVAWPAYGIARFTPRVFAAPWQGQQALHAHIACDSREAAETLCAALAAHEVERYLRAFDTAGTRNFAQPGRVRRLLVDQKSSQMTT